jgi:hypothetical protein
VVTVIPGVSGRLITASFAREAWLADSSYAAIPPDRARAIVAWARRCANTIGPAAGARVVTDAVLLPLLELLGFRVEVRSSQNDHAVVRMVTGTTSVVGLATAFGAPLTAAWRDAVRAGISADARWCLCCNGVALRVVDARRTWSRDYLEFDLQTLGDSIETQSLLWSLARAEAIAAGTFERALVLSARHGIDVCRALGVGVLHALRLLVSALAARQRRFPSELLLEHSLTVLYRVLFLLFAEARGLVPLWHPLYRDRYSLESIVETLFAGRRYRGLWHAVQAISRLAHAGCSAGELKVTAFNGRLFSPAHAFAFDRTRIDDDVLGEAVVAVSATATGRSRTRIAYRDLDVEQLGAVYEQVLDYQAAPAAGTVTLVRGGDARKATGTFYTPRAMTGFLVRRTLEPLVAGRSAEDILKLRVLDPAMGSGAFLVAACRYLAAAAEESLIREGRWHPHDVTAAERAALRRDIASRCLFGVDLNPMAVQLARLSLWLASLAADKPLSFLDHHLVAGNSLVGAAPDDVRRQPGGGSRRTERHQLLPLFEAADVAPVLAAGVSVRERLSADPDDSAAMVRAKERALAALQHRDAALGRWSRLLDLWCAGWFREDGAAPDRQTFGELAARILHDRGRLPDRLTERLLADAERVAARERFLHWPLAFPEVFAGVDGALQPQAGFDAVIGNPPWDMVRGDSGDEALRGGRRRQARCLTDFVRESGIYHVETRAHANRYQLFVERAIQLTRPGGRIGLVLPAGIASDAGAAPVRRFLFERTQVDEITGLDNREAIFPIHRSVRFVLLTCTSGVSTSAIRCRFGISRPERLEQQDVVGTPLVMTRQFLTRLSGADDMGIPELAGDMDLRLVERISATFPRLSAADGWNAQFGRELNASDDRDAFEAFTGSDCARPVIEGKQIDPFRVSLDQSRYQVRADAEDATLRRVPRRARLAYRDVASATNRLTLIAAIIPARAVTTHTLFCLKTVLPIAAQQVLCALLNSYVANYFIRFRVNTHVTVALLSRLPTPPLRPSDPAFDRIAALTRALLHSARPAEEMDEYAELQALVGRLYGLSTPEFEHVLGTFPLIPQSLKSHVLSVFEQLH